MEDALEFQVPIQGSGQSQSEEFIVTSTGYSSIIDLHVGFEFRDSVVAPEQL
jgi:hypothetical protein